MSEGLFRQEALDARERVVRLQNKMQVTTPWTRKALAGLLVLAAVAVGWSAFVSVPLRVNGNGLFVETSGELLKPARAAMDGIVEALLVAEGELVVEGQPVARLRLPERLNALAKAERDHAAALQRVAETDRIQEVERAGEARGRSERRGAVVERLANLERRLVWQTELEADTTRLVDLGIATRTRLNEVKVQTQQLLDQIAVAKNDAVAIDVEAIASANRMERERMTVLGTLHQHANEITSITAEIERGTLVKSPVTGRVAELSAERNGVATAGQPILSVIPAQAGGRIEAIAFIALADGKLVKVGDEVQVRPASLPAREQGRLRGVVTDVSDAPVTDRALTRTLGNAALVAQANAAGAPFAVRISLAQSGDAPSGYAWTSGNGPDIRLSAGTPVTTRITIERETLLTLAIPALRRAVGAGD